MQSNITWDTVNKIFMGIVVVGLVGLFTWIIVIKEDIQNAKDETLDVVKSEIQKINSNIQLSERRLEQNSAALEQRLEKNSAALERRIGTAIENKSASLDERLEQNSAALEQRLEKNSAALERLRQKMDDAMDDTFELVERRLGKAIEEELGSLDERLEQKSAALDRLRKNMDEVEYSVKELKGRLHTAMKDKFPLLDTHEGRIASLERRLRKNRISSLEQRLRKNMDEVEETVDDLQGKLAAIVEKKSPVPGDHAGRNSSRQQP